MTRGSRTRLRIVLFAAIVIVINVVAFAAFTWPRLNQVRRAEDRAQEVSARRDALETVWTRVVARREVAAQNRRDIETLSREYLKSRSADLFMAQREVERLARAAGLSPKKSSYALEEIKGTGLVRCEMTLPLDGSYANLTDFLTRIEGASRFIVVDQLALSRDQEGARMNLQLSAIFRSEEDPLASR